MAQTTPESPLSLIRQRLRAGANLALGGAPLDHVMERRRRSRKCVRSTIQSILLWGQGAFISLPRDPGKLEKTKWVFMQPIRGYVK